MGEANCSIYWDNNSISFPEDVTSVDISIGAMVGSWFHSNLNPRVFRFIPLTFHVNDTISNYSGIIYIRKRDDIDGKFNLVDLVYMDPMSAFSKWDEIVDFNYNTLLKILKELE